MDDHQNSGRDVDYGRDESEEYFSARSHFSEDAETDDHSRDEEAASQTSIDDTNAKVDRLVAILLAGRQIVLTPNEASGDIDVSVVLPNLGSGGGSVELEAAIARAPQNFGTIVKSWDEMARSATSEQRDIDSFALSAAARHQFLKEAVEEAQELGRWPDYMSVFGEDAGAGAAVTPLGVDPGTLQTDRAKIRRALRLQEQALEIPRGRRLATLGEEGVEIRTISPIPLDYDRLPPEFTPPASSDDGASSPLIRLSYSSMVRYADSWATESQSEHDGEEDPAVVARVHDWLEKVEPPPQVKSPILLKGSSKKIRVFKDAGTDRPRPQRTGNTPSAKMLKDISNLRRPGYLQHNSFAMVKSEPAPPNIPFRTKPIMDRQPQYLAPMEGREPSSERKAHWELAMSRLEGRGPR